MNGELSASLHEPLYAALWSFGSGWVLLTAVLLASRRTRAGVRAVVAAVRTGRLPLWQSLGGLLGGTYVLVQAYAVPLAGVALFTVAVVGGQTGNAIVVDRLGLGPSGRTAVTRVRVLAAALATVGVAIAVFGRVHATSGPVVAAAAATGAAVVVPVALALLVGGLHAVQSAINGRVNVVSGTPWATTWLNFTNGVALLLAVAAVRRLTGGLGAVQAVDPPAWVWFGGVAGVVFVGVVAVVVRHLGVLHTMLVLLCGQLLGAVVLDLVNPATRHTVTVVVVGGLVLTAVAAALPSLLSGASRATRR